jgi:hypothetical protein
MRNMVMYQSQLPLQNHMFPSVMYLSKPVYMLNRSMGHLWLYYYFVVLAVALVSSVIAMTLYIFVNISSARVTHLPDNLGHLLQGSFKLCLKLRVQSFDGLYIDIILRMQVLYL